MSAIKDELKFAGRQMLIGILNPFSMFVIGLFVGMTIGH